jgi:hypothetical protein
MTASLSACGRNQRNRDSPRTVGLAPESANVITSYIVCLRRGSRGSTEGRDQTVAGWNSSVLPSGSLHSIWMRPPGCVFSTYLMPSRSSVAFIAS